MFFIKSNPVRYLIIHWSKSFAAVPVTVFSHISIKWHEPEVYEPAHFDIFRSGLKSRGESFQWWLLIFRVHQIYFMSSKWKILTSCSDLSAPSVSVPPPSSTVSRGMFTEHFLMSECIIVCVWLITYQVIKILLCSSFFKCFCLFWWINLIPS